MLSCNISSLIFEYDYNIHGCINELCSNAEIASYYNVCYIFYA